MDVMHRAQRAQAIINDPVFVEAFNVVLSNQTAVFASSESSESQIMEAHRMVRALRAVKDQIQSAIVDGKIFERRLEKEKQHRG
jgi:type 1 glutamine amidotransferase